MNCIIIHYAEIGLKKGKRAFFENKLMHNIEKKTGFRPERHYGSLIIDGVSQKKYELIKNELSNTPGIAYFCHALKATLTINSIINKAGKLLVKNKTFKVVTKRSNKAFKHTSVEVNKLVGEHFYNKGFKVDVHNPEQRLYVEILEKNAYVYAEKIKGLGGLPVGSSGKLLLLVSGGIDSPVSAYYMMKRGCRVEFIHFYNERTGVKEKIIELAGILSKFQGKSIIYLIPFMDIQKEIILKTPSDKRMIIYRRLMLRIAERIAEQIKAKGLITGDSAGQVASQTLDNLRVIWNATSLPVYAPLIGFDKEEIINIAKRIGTYETSILPYSDCCSYLVARHPETRAKLEDIERIEKKLNIERLVKKGLSNKEVIHTR